MNYLAHARSVLDRPYALAGSALPDWLRACHPRQRLRRRHVEREWLDADESTSGLLFGIQLHFADDERFHSHPRFLELVAGLARSLRERFPDDRRMRASFLGHIFTELILDACLVEARPHILDDYYKSVETVDSAHVTAVME